MRRGRVAVLAAAVLAAWVDLARGEATPVPPSCPTPPPKTGTPCSCSSSTTSSASACNTRAHELLVTPKDGERGRMRVEKVLRTERVDYRWVPPLEVFHVLARSPKRAKQLERRLRPLAERIEPNHGYRSETSLPNDAKFGEQWGLHHAKDFDINAPAAWATPPAVKQALIGIIDSGVEFGTDEMKGRLWKNPGETAAPDGVDSDGNGWIDDAYGINATGAGQTTFSAYGYDTSGHGTAVASIIAANKNNTVGMAGVSPGVQLIPCRATTSDCATAVDVSECLAYFTALRKKGHNVVAANISLAGTGCSCTLEKEIREARKAGVIVVAAAGNENKSNDAVPRYPARHPVSNVIAVGAHDSAGAKADYNWGPRSVHVLAPGTGIVVLQSGGAVQTTTKSGTSFAAPHVSGVLGLLALKGITDWFSRRNLVLAGGEPFVSPTPMAATLTGRRVRAVDTGGHGAMSCSAQKVRRRILPLPDTCRMTSTRTELVVRAQSIECAASVKPTVQFKKTTATSWSSLPVNDEGVYPDEFGGDGEWAGVWARPAPTSSYEIKVVSPSTVTTDLLKVVP